LRYDSRSGRIPVLAVHDLQISILDATPPLL
jgi:hypothetical protein